MVAAARGTHPLQRDWRARELLRKRSSSDRLRAGAAVRAGRIDPNPHQIEAVRFALERLPEGGAVLADEVGLGKTIEAGLVIAQRIAEGAQRVLLIAPKPLLGQWRQELESLFGLMAREGGGDLRSPGIVMLGREAATSDKGFEALRDAPEFDLIVVDEAHELFSGLHQRFDDTGAYRPERPKARSAGRLFELLRHSDVPVLLLTATPIQNRLVELWSLIQYIDRSGTLLGALPTFRALFAADGQGRTLKPEAEEDLRQRLADVVQRTLRRQAQDFLPQPFVERTANNFTYVLSSEERALYEDVTEYLLTPRLAAFSGNARRLLLIGFHRQLSSSRRALARSLGRVAERLEARLAGETAARTEHDVRALADEFEDEDLPGRAEDTDETPMTEEEVAAELERVRGLVQRAQTIEQDAKLDALCRAIQSVVVERGTGRGSGKAVIFTESLATQKYLRDALLRRGLVSPGDVTLFRGTNDGPRAKEALQRWREETQQDVAPRDRPTPDVAVRLALVHEFRTRSRVFISTEAGAKGLNLQFCETVINYDLPWNPQRIEQRIGRCHRYGQTRAVNVINFLAEDNEVEALLYEILSTKLELFDQVLGASDVVLGADLASSVGSELERTLSDIHERARTRDEIVEALRRVRDDFDDRRREFIEAHQRTGGLIESTFDEEVRRVFKGHKETLDGPLVQLDREMLSVLEDYLDDVGVPHQLLETPTQRTLKVAGDHRLPEGFEEPFELAIGHAPARTSLHLGHPLLEAAAAHARRTAEAVTPEAIQIQVEEDLAALRGRRGRACVMWVRVDGFEVVDLFVPIILLDGEDDPLALEDARRILSRPWELATPSGAAFDDIAYEDAIEEALFEAGAPVDTDNLNRHERRLSRLERSIEDRCRLLGDKLRGLQARLEKARDDRDNATGPDKRADAERRMQRTEGEIEHLEDELRFLRSREDEDYQRLRARDMKRRYMPPTPQRLFDVELFLR